MGSPLSKGGFGKFDLAGGLAGGAEEGAEEGEGSGSEGPGSDEEWLEAQSDLFAAAKVETNPSALKCLVP